MRRTPRRPFACALLALLACCASPGAADAADAPGTPIAPLAPNAPELPPGVIARVSGREVTAAEFEAHLVERLRRELDEQGSSTLGVFQILVEELVVRAEAERLGIRVTTEDYDRRYAQLDAQVRAQSGGERSLAKLVEEQGLTPVEFRARLEDVIRKERIAGHPSYLGAALPKDEAARVAHVEVVIQQLLKKAVIRRDGLPAGVVATVDGAPMTVAAFGAALRARLGAGEVRRHLQELCVTMLLDKEGLAFAVADVDAEIEWDRPLFDRMRSEAVTSEKRDLPFDAFLQLRYSATRDELRASPYRRGLFALRRRLRAAVSDDDVLKEWTSKSQAEYGPTIVVTDVMVGFRISNAVTEPVRRQSENDALRRITDIQRRLATEPIEAIAREFKAAKDRSVLVERRAVIQTGNDQLVFEAAAKLADGQWSAPMKTMSEFHLIRREAARPAPQFQDVKAVVRQHLVDQRAASWLRDQLEKNVATAR